MASDDEKLTLKERWERVPPHRKRNYVIMAAGAALILLLYMFVMATPQRTTGGGSGSQRQDVVSNILTGADTRQLGIEGLSNRTQELERKVRSLFARLDTLHTKLKNTKKQLYQQQQHEITPRELHKKIQQVKYRLKQKIKQQPSIKKRLKNMSDAEVEKIFNTLVTQSEVKELDLSQPDEDKGQKPGGEVSDAEVVTQTEEPVTVKRKVWLSDIVKNRQMLPPPQGGGGKKQPYSGNLSIRVVGATAVNEPGAAGATGQDGGGAQSETLTYLPAGSMISGVLITGMAAPTSNVAKTHPFPALVRVKKSAILPNGYRLDVQECFILASGYGDLSSERVYLRAEVLSCIRNDGGVIEVPLNAYAVGEDGKVGLAGRVVSKQGQILARSLMAGFLSGLSQLFGQVPVPSIETSGEISDEVQYQSLLSKESLTAGAIQGASKALDRLAQFYLKMAQDLYPVIEINAGRKVTFVVTNGVRLKTVNQ